MTPSELLAELERRGIILRPEGDAIRYTAPKGAMTDELREAIRRHKPEIVALLRRRVLDEWPAECLEAEQRFGCPEARLYPLLRKEVRAPEGAGTLWQVLSAERVGVVREVDGQKCVIYFSLEEVEPNEPASARPGRLGKVAKPRTTKTPFYKGEPYWEREKPEKGWTDGVALAY